MLHFKVLNVVKEVILWPAFKICSDELCELSTRGGGGSGTPLTENCIRRVL
jgi:hypothetical protein